MVHSFALFEPADDNEYTLVAADCDNDIISKSLKDAVLEKGKQVIPAGFKSIVKTVDLESKKVNLFCFICSIPPLSEDKENLILCLSTVEENISELVIEDLRWFYHKLGKITPYNIENIKRMITLWNTFANGFVTEVVSHLGDNCIKLLMGSLLGFKVKLMDFPLGDNFFEVCCERFSDACHLYEIGIVSGSDNLTVKEDCVVHVQSLGNKNFNVELLDSDGNVFHLTESEFCKEWFECLKSEAEASGNYLEVRRLLENYRTRVLQDLNFCNRLMKSAEADYYGFYRLYLFVRSHTNASVLLTHLTRSQSVFSSDVGSVIKSLSLALSF